MTGVTRHLKRLRGRSLREIAERGTQELGKLAERLSDAGEMSDRRLLAEISPAFRNCSGEGSAQLIVDRIRLDLANGRMRADGGRSEPNLFAGLERRDELAELMESRFSEEREAIIERAERALKGRFDLLGFADLSFGDPIDWLLEPISGKRAPLAHWSRIDYLNPEVAGDKKVTWELNRHGHFITMGQAFVITQDERYAESFVRQAEAWMDANPPTRGINWASSLEIAFRSISWIWALHLFAPSRALTSKFLARFVKNLITNGRHIEAYLSHYFSPNTHLTGEALGLFYLGVLLPELKRADQWRETGLRIMLEQLPRHIHRDGVYFEQSTYYHRYTADFYTHLLLLARAANIDLPEEVKNRLASMLDHLMWITRPDGSSPLIGDDDGGRLLKLGSRQANDFRDTLATGAAMFARGDWKFVAGDAGIEALWLLGPEGLRCFDEIRSRRPDQTSRAFEDGGYYVMRDGWGDGAIYAVVDCGRHGAIGGGHAHSDALAFEFGSAGTTWLVDPGTFSYTGDVRERDWFRSTEAHNTVTVDGESQSLAGGPFSWRHSANSVAREFISGKGFDYFEGSHDGYERLADPVTHTRSVLFVKSAASNAPGYLLVLDSFKARLDHCYAIRYHLEAGTCARANAGRIVATQQDHEIAITSFGGTQPTVGIESGWVSHCYGQREAAPVALIEGGGIGPQEFLSFIVPGRAGGPAWLPQRVDTASLPGPEAGSCRPPTESASGKASAADAGAATESRSQAFTVGAEDYHDSILLGDGAKHLRSELLAARGSIAFARFSGKEIADCGLRIADLKKEAANSEREASRLIRAFLVSGDSLEAGGIKFNSHGPAKYCELEIRENSVELSLAGTDRFELAVSEGFSRLELNGSTFELEAGRRYRFTNVLARWKHEEIADFEFPDSK